MKKATAAIAVVVIMAASAAAAYIAHPPTRQTISPTVTEQPAEQPLTYQTTDPVIRAAHVTISFPIGTYMVTPPFNPATYAWAENFVPKDTGTDSTLYTPDGWMVTVDEGRKLIEKKGDEGTLECAVALKNTVLGGRRVKYCEHIPEGLGESSTFLYEPSSQTGIYIVSPDLDVVHIALALINKGIVWK